MKVVFSFRPGDSHLETKLRSRFIIDECFIVSDMTFTFSEQSVGPVQWATRSARKKRENCLKCGWTQGHQTHWESIRKFDSVKI